MGYPPCSFAGEEVVPQLRDAKVRLEDLFLDPNNIRYAAIDALNNVAENKIQDEAVQRKALERMLLEQFDVRQIKRSIAAGGFFPIDRLIVVELPPDKGKYVVIEGNRRVAAMKSLQEEIDTGEVTVSDDVKSSIANVPVVIVEDQDRDARYRMAHTLQGIRHVSSIKDWVPYAKAQLIPVMEADGKTLKEIREELGLTAPQVTVFRRVLAALKQMQDDNEYGEYFKPRLWGHFEEALKKPEIRKWLGWDDDQLRMTDDEHAELFYGWCVGLEEDGDRLPPKIPDAKDIRKLSDVLEDTDSFKRFREDPKLNVQDAWHSSSKDESSIDWRAILKDNIRTLELVPAIELEKGESADRDLLKTVKNLCDTLLKHMP